MQSDYAEFIKQTFDKYKCKNKFDLLMQIPIYNDENETIAYLRPLTKDYKTTMSGIISTMSHWRRENPTISAGTFEITDERTEKFIDNLIINRDDRLVFIIQGINGNYLGHIGYSSFIFDEFCGEVDTVLRGDKNAIPGLMTFAMKSLIYWGIHTLKLSKIVLRVFEDNIHAYEFYKRFGFYEINKIPMLLVHLEDEAKWEPAPENYVGRIERYYLKMALNANVFAYFKGCSPDKVRTATG